MVLQKEDIWERLITNSEWITSDTPTGNVNDLFAVVPERQFRYVVGIWIKGNMDQTICIRFRKMDEDDNLVTTFSPIPVAPADFRQIPKGSYSITDPILTFEGGTRLYAQTDLAGSSLNVTVNYWDWDV